MPTEPAFTHSRKTVLAYINGLRQDGINAAPWAKGCLTVVCPLSDRCHREHGDAKKAPT